MKKLLSILILIVAFYAASFSQANQNMPCPTVNVKASLGSRANEPITFTAKVSKEAENSNPKYVWTVFRGELLEGQGTFSIKVLPKEGEAEVMIKVEGLAEGCSPSDLDTIVIDYDNSILIDEFSIKSTKVNEAGLDNLISELQKTSYSQAYIIEYFKKNTPQKTINQKIQKIWDYLINVRKQNKERFKIAVSSLDENVTRFWIIPEGATLPIPDD